MKTRYSIFGAVAALGLVVAVGAPVHAQVSARIGVLSCDMSAGVGLILTRNQTLTCQFTPDGGQPESYSGSIQKFGIEIGKIEAGHLVWSVASALKGVPKGSLAGVYAGVGADAAVGAGVGANVLVGGSGRAFSLQPLSVQSETGVNIAAGITTITLKAN